MKRLPARVSAILTIVGVVVVVAATILLALNLLIGNKQIDSRLAPEFAVDTPEFQRTMGTVLEPALVEGNRVRALVNGDQIFPAMLDAIRSAQKSVTLETYIYWSGPVGKEFAEALRERARQGVRIDVIIDWFGSELDDVLREQMQRSGIAIHRYNPLAWTTLDRINHRTHRRLLVVDGQVGFIGGAGISDKWSGDAEGPAHWRDTHFQVEGPVVAQLQSAFLDHWIKTAGEVPRSEAFLPPLKPRGEARAHVFKASPGGGAKSMQLMYLLSISSARKSIDLSAAYFLPDEVALRSLVAAMNRGVRLRVIMPGPYMDVSLVARSSRAKWGALLAAGAELYQYQPTMFHCKVMVVDGLWVSVGSTNFDSRSFTINDEANLNVYDGAFARAQTEIFERDLERSKRFTSADWEALPWWTKAVDVTATALDSQL
ncbi:MAG: phosphatidylserine/phosphatidylglycerophosphate/cardiolipin synthase family protein [Pseudomonadota bacterium]|nr:phosphatidylserine/phosphatidylglycerophosphate/cardiolipin synthase family protein [Pseudomonadota bacterium]